MAFRFNTYEKAPVPTAGKHRGTRTQAIRFMVTRYRRKYTCRPSVATLRKLIAARAFAGRRIAGTLHLHQRVAA